MEQRPKKRGDRFDGYWLRDEAPALGQFMAYLMPNRADNEAHINVDIDCRPLDAFLAKKNEGRTEDKYTYFHIFLAAMVKCFVLRPRMNRFISGNRLYMRDHISVSFVVKKKFEDKSEEGLAYKKYGEQDTIDTLHTSIMEEIHQCRREDVLDNSTDIMTKLLKLPRWLLRIIVNILFLDLTRSIQEIHLGKVLRLFAIQLPESAHDIIATFFLVAGLCNNLERLSAHPKACDSRFLQLFLCWAGQEDLPDLLRPDR